jgi:hypothetical protein|tara:strand:- start:472 stop:621 length:150 start_codon:yes stop_codon:yes gene_type:complete
MMEIYTVWVGGVPANCYPVSLREAQQIADSYFEEGYQDVHICMSENVYD